MMLAAKCLKEPNTQTKEVFNGFYERDSLENATAKEKSVQGPPSMRQAMQM
jgi:hypothetical protein